MKNRTKTQSLVLVALMAALIAITTQITVPIGPVPFSMAVFGVFFAAALLPPAQMAASLGVYLIIGLVGMPVFAGFKGGPQVLLGPTGGYLAGYFVMGLATAFAIKYTRHFALHLAAAVAGMAGCYVLGTLWYMLQSGSGFWAGLAACVLPFVIPDAAKIVLALVLARAVAARLQKERMAA